tara:strand:- start:385 stop:675 length:291 start_codon:yes stop_codon:yes gene_type:complete
VKDGKETTEYSLSKKAFWTAVLLPGVAAAIQAIQGSGMIQNPTALAIIGVIGAVLTALGYGVARTVQKGQHQRRESVTIASMMATNALPAPPEKKQ